MSRHYSKQDRIEICTKTIDMYNSNVFSTFAECCKKNRLREVTFYKWCKEHEYINRIYLTKRKSQKPFRHYIDSHILEYFINKYIKMRNDAKLKNEFLVITNKEISYFKGCGFNNYIIAEILGCSEYAIRYAIKKNVPISIDRIRKKTDTMKENNILRIWEHIPQKDIARIIKLLTWNLRDKKESAIDYLYTFLYSRDLRTKFAKTFLAMPCIDGKLGYLYWYLKRERKSYFRQHKNNMPYEKANSSMYERMISRKTTKVF